MVTRGSGPDFIEAVARGFDVVRTFTPESPTLTLSEVAARTDLSRPTARRMLLTLMELGYVRESPAGFCLTPRVLELGLTYIQSHGLWDLARPHLESLVSRTHQSSSIAQLDGSDIVYVARVAVPKIISLAVSIGTRFPAVSTSLGRVLLADLPPDELEVALSEPSRSGIEPRYVPDDEELQVLLAQTRARGWVMTDEHLAGGIRSIAAPVRDGSGAVIAATNVTVHAAEISVETLTDEFLPQLIRTAGDISADVVSIDRIPQVIAPR
ncbi:IclR family transcriptional regulator domain-containing protein [Aeromicrobium chenweiae]|uniref:IclR family transcriptional regulator n=1 Tax=Aeromicrobium chenweiae TaxID=2079793 RepID=A0A2S0WQ37_9ACTN|nr:IclR family transcriptional regulator C-terminal domain-containing protein [Aeromicrobium chenweiae]AWB93473.1 IclR family transcriptional regulator [Aeromicrobium chenweiae]TGN34466.1 IclR family transcriptional regulator [Aeromicrobium chenweiae]